MSDIRCRHCGTVGLVRQERIITAQEFAIEYKCQRCLSVWREGNRRRGPDRRMNREDRRKAG